MKAIAKRILVSLLEDQEERLRDRLDVLQGKVGWVELRLDSLPSETDLEALLADYPALQFIAAILLESEGGCYQGDAAQRARRLQQVSTCGFAYVDLPLGSAAIVLSAAVKRIVSWHQSADEEYDLEQLLAEARLQAGSGGLVKLVPFATNAEDSLAAVILQQQHADLVAFAQGPGGSASRVMSLLAGAAWIYSCWPGAPTASGQWDYASLLCLLPDTAGLQTQVFGVVGQAVESSLSPLLWNHAFRSVGMDALYLRFPVAHPRRFFSAAATCGVVAVSVTAPWKQVAAEVAQNFLASGAANFLMRQNDQWTGYQTDGVGALDSLLAHGFDPKGKILLLGAGGAALGVAFEAQQRGYDLTVSARRAEQAQGLQASCSTNHASIKIMDWQRLRMADFDAVIQATSMGGSAAPASPTPGQTPAASTLTLDMVYQPLRTEWLQEASRAGAEIILGTEMLIRQMQEQFRIATNQSCDYQSLSQVLHDELQEGEAVVLIGARACGKTSLGRSLAQRLGWRFVDADEELEKQHRRSLAEWIANDLQGFRDAERDLLPQLLALRHYVVALGGGVVEREESVQRLALASRVVFVQCPVEVLLERQLSEPRPPLLHIPLAEEIEQLLAHRLASYKKCADFTLENDGEFRESVERLATNSVLKLFPLGTR